ncbi:MAG: putative RNA methyltransferase, partial [Acidimicrobiales bacterium]
RDCHSRVMPPPDVLPGWRCPVCREQLSLVAATWSCPAGHRFDVAREGYVNLLVAGQRRSRRPGDSPEMVRARQRLLATGLYDPLSEAVSAAVAESGAGVVLDVGCGEGRHARALRAPAVLGIDVAKKAVAAASRAHPAGRYAVATAGDVPLREAAVDAALLVFGPAVAEELARVVRPGGVVVAAHPGPRHLEQLRTLVYPDAHHHAVKSPLRHGASWFEEIGSQAVTFPVALPDRQAVADLFTMTPYRWHAPPDMEERLDAATRRPFATVADVRVTVYRRRVG